MSNKKLSEIFRIGTGLRLLNSIISHKQQGVLLINLDGTIMFANSLINGLLANGQDSLRNTSVFKFVSADDADSITSIVSSLIEESRSNSAVYQIRLRTDDAEYKSFEAHGVGIYSDAGMLECVELCLIEGSEPMSQQIA